ncbi:MAG: O-antigen ligase family protein [Patescibacteria group bacterium]|nr:O-antigen ligase family protein [Patescibacteria group bacterium]
MHKPDAEPVSPLVRFINALLIGVILLLPAGQFLRIGNSGIYLLDPVLAIITVLLVFYYRLSPFHRLRTAPLAQAVLWFLGWNVISFIAGFRLPGIPEHLTAAAYLLRLSVYLVFMLYLLLHCSRRGIRRALLDAAVLTSGAFIVLGAGVQYFFYPDLRPLMYAGWDPHFARAFGTFLEPVVLAAMLGIFGIGLCHSGSRGSAAIVPFVLVSFLATFSRGAWIALTGALAAGIPRKYRLTALVITLLIGILAIFLLPKPGGEGVNLLRTSTIISREADYQQGIALWLAHPIAGVGYNRIGSFKTTESAPGSQRNNAANSFHATYLTVLATSGIVGLLLFANLLLTLARLHGYTNTVVIFLGILSLFDNMLLHPFVLIGLAIGSGRFLTPPSYKLG